MRDVVFGVSRATAITTTQVDPSLPPHSSIIMAIIDQWAALLGTSSQQNLSSQVYCLGRGFVKGYSATEEPGPVITGKLMAGLIYILSTPATLTLGLFIFIMFNNYFKLFLFSRNDNNCILDIEITITISIASDASV